MGTKVKGFIRVTSDDNTVIYISIDSIESFKDHYISTLSDNYDVMETAEHIALLIDEERE